MVGKGDHKWKSSVEGASMCFIGNDNGPEWLSAERRAWGKERLETMMVQICTV